MQRSRILHLVIIASALLSLLLVSTTYSSITHAQNSQTKFRAKLDSNNEVPPVNSTAEGIATLKVKDNTINTKINITGITDLSGAQINTGKKGENGEPIIDLLKTGKKTKIPGGVAIEGSFTASDFEGPMKGKALSALQSAMGTNETYVNIKTTDHPDGETRGQIKPKGSSTQ
ncbi:MAG: CHRD domain-containing protein [Thaumarchaeota archaeon]|nr:MAG: CHRD domain-containing protein [Nitrososphaerota archaeon]